MKRAFLIFALAALLLLLFCACGSKDADAAPTASEASSQLEADPTAAPADPEADTAAEPADPISADEEQPDAAPEPPAPEESLEEFDIDLLDTDPFAEDAAALALPESYAFFPDICALLPLEGDGWQCALSEGTYVLTNEPQLGSLVMFQLECIDQFGAYSASDMQIVVELYLSQVRSQLANQLDNPGLKFEITASGDQYVGNEHKGYASAGSITGMDSPYSVEAASWRCGTYIYFMYFIADGEHYDAASAAFSAMLSGFQGVDEYSADAVPSELLTVNELDAFNAE